ncbi:chlorophyll synthesis pathway protein BchC [Falsiroseomonas sp. HC035]|uniref:chlorophyll synthesis pathway protein BchC n=1 Tax=Falsiroseomonas sp. HC035 TaxID=3390999 RepID=UPI003D31580A
MGAAVQVDTVAVLLEAPERLVLSRLELSPPGEGDLVVDVEWSGISTGTERLLWSGRMPPFPGMGYPLVPGYESVGRVVSAGPLARRRVGERVFVPGAKCFGPVRGLFGGAASRLVVPDARAVQIDESLGEEGVLMALAATARHAIAAPHADLPDLVIGHGVLGRLVARIVVASGGAPMVWETNPARAEGAIGYQVMAPEDDARRDYRCICDVSGDSALLDSLVQRLAPGGEVVLAGFYSAPLSFAFPPAFMREARFRVAAEWRQPDLLAVRDLLDAGRLSFEGLITHRSDAAAAPDAYRTAFNDPACLKMILDWRACS